MSMHPLSFRVPFRLEGCDTSTLRIDPTQYWPPKRRTPVLANWYENAIDTSSFGVRADLFFSPDGGKIAVEAMIEHGMDRRTARHIYRGMQRLVRETLGGAGYLQWLPA